MHFKKKKDIEIKPINDKEQCHCYHRTNEEFNTTIKKTKTNSKRKFNENYKTSEEEYKEKEEKEEEEINKDFIQTAVGSLCSKDSYHYSDGHKKNEKYLNSSNYIDDYNLSELTQLHRIERRLQYIEESLGNTQIIEATPIAALIYVHESANFAMNKVYDNWIRFMNYIAQQLKTKTVENLFWTADEYIFEFFFKNKTTILKYYFIDFEIMKSVPEFNSIIKLALEGDRNLLDGKLINPQDNEYIHVYFDNSNQTIFIFYSEQELQNLYKSTDKIESSSNNNHSLISGLDSYSLPISHNNRIDKRFKVLGAHRILYNTYINASTGKIFNTSLQGMGISALNICVILIHAMLHLKCLLEKNISPIENMRHSNKSFITEVIKYLPSTLYGHPMLPIVTHIDN